MELIQFDCPHCEGTGTCKASNGISCGTCMKAAKVKRDFQVVRCDVCDGSGKVEPKTQRLIGRLPFFIVSIVLFVFYIYSFLSLFFERNFDQIFPLIGSLTTMIVTFYFTKK